MVADGCGNRNNQKIDTNITIPLTDPFFEINGVVKLLWPPP
jgi:hypothetical protein